MIYLKAGIQGDGQVRSVPDPQGRTGFGGAGGGWHHRPGTAPRRIALRERRPSGAGHGEPCEVRELSSERSAVPEGSGGGAEGRAAERLDSKKQ